MNFDVLELKNLIPIQLQVNHNVECRSLNHAFGYDVILLALLNEWVDGKRNDLLRISTDRTHTVRRGSKNMTLRQKIVIGLRGTK